MRISIGAVRLDFCVEGCGLVPDGAGQGGAGMAGRPVITALHGGPGADHAP